MEPGHAAQQVSDARAPSGAILSPGEPAVAAVFEPCWRRVEPDFAQACPNPATGALRITLRPAESVEKRFGLRSLMSLVMPVTLCSSCFPKVQFMEVTDEDLRKRLVKTAQQMNKGVLPDWSRTLIEHVPFGDPHYMALRAAMRPQAANDSQPGPAGPQQGAGDGNDGIRPGG